MSEQFGLSVDKMPNHTTMYNELNKLPDGAYVITAAAILDERLKLVFESFLVTGKHESIIARDLMEPDGVLGSYDARAQIAYVLGLISENEYHDLKAIGRIRNRFAHELSGLTFADEGIKGRTNGLKLSQQNSELSPRARFNSALVSLLRELSSRAIEVRGISHKRIPRPERGT